MLVIADDYGCSASVNAGVLSAFSAGLISGASIMANQPAFEEAAAGAHELGIADVVGLHFVLSEGEPLTTPMRRCSPFCDNDGRFVLWRRGRPLLRLSQEVNRCLADELRAQVARAHGAGIALSHLDSHHHVHTEPAVAAVVIAVCREVGIPRVRLGRNAGHGRDPVNRSYKVMLNRRVRRAGLAGTRYFGSVHDFASSPARRRASFEVMVHPELDRSGRMVDAGSPDSELSEFLGRNGVPVVARGRQEG